MDPRVIRALGGIGVGARELDALEYTKMHTLPETSEGFGLIGPTGTGKTAALVQWVGDRIINFLTSAPPGTYPAFNSVWLNWPETAEIIKRLVVSPRSADLDEAISNWKSCPTLYLDDLGQERTKGDDDYSLGILREILDARYRNKLRLFWTSNLEPKAMQSLYGARITGRILEAWPPIVIKGHDLRTRKPQP